MVNVKIKLENFGAILHKALDQHTASLRNNLRSLDDGSFIERAGKASPKAVITMMPSKIDVGDEAREKELKSCFIDIVRSLIDFIDAMIAIIEVANVGVPVTRQLKGEKAILRYAEDHLNAEIQKIATDTRLKNPQKIDRFVSFDGFAKQSCEGYFDLRNCFEHHKGIAKEDITLCYRVMQILVNEDEIDSLPRRVETGDKLRTVFNNKCRSIKRGATASITEEEIDAVVFTIKLVVVPAILQSVSQAISKQ